MNSAATLTIYEGQDVWTVARVTLPTGAALKQADVPADATDPVEAHVYLITDGAATLKTKYKYSATAGWTADTTLGAHAAPGSGGCLSDTLLTDGYWSGDATGYNFRHQIPGSNFDAGGGRYRIEYSITTSSYGTMFVVTEVASRALSHS